MWFNNIQYTLCFFNMKNKCPHKMINMNPGTANFMKNTCNGFYYYMNDILKDIFVRSFIAQQHLKAMRFQHGWAHACGIDK